ncbi:hypothetical protein STEG23_028660, partial [Scotinomys teguina]
MPITRQSSRSPVKERRRFYEQVHQDHDGKHAGHPNQTRGTHESWINGCRACLGLDLAFA